MPGLNQRRFFSNFCGLNRRSPGKELADTDRVGCIVSALVNDFEAVIFADNRGGNLNTACTRCLHSHPPILLLLLL